MILLACPTFLVASFMLLIWNETKTKTFVKALLTTGRSRITQLSIPFNKLPCYEWRSNEIKQRRRVWLGRLYVICLFNNRGHWEILRKPPYGQARWPKFPNPRSNKQTKYMFVLLNKYSRSNIWTCVAPIFHFVSIQ